MRETANVARDTLFGGVIACWNPAEAGARREEGEEIGGEFVRHV